MIFRPTLILMQLGIALYLATALTDGISEHISALSSVLEQTLR